MVRYTAEMLCVVSWKPGIGSENGRTVSPGTSNTGISNKIIPGRACCCKQPATWRKQAKLESEVIGCRRLSLLPVTLGLELTSAQAFP